MNKVFSFFIILFCFSNLLAIEEVNPSRYSLLFESIRTDEVNKALLNLPKKEFIEYLPMLKEMEKTKKSYNLNDAESAYLAYKWIAQNIEVKYYLVNDYPQSVYDFRQGSPSGISKLFIQMCNYLKVESKAISGYIKSIRDSYSDEFISKIESTWNYIVIGGLTYLVDVSFGAGYFDEKKFEKEYSDFFFGTKPEIFINYHFPNDIKWQLLSHPITLEKFDSLPFINNVFYLLGFKNFSPDYKEIKINNKIIFELTYDNSIGDISLETIIHNDYSYNYGCAKIVNSNGKFEITLSNPFISNVYIFEISINIANNYGSAFVPLIIYQLMPTV